MNERRTVDSELECREEKGKGGSQDDERKLRYLKKRDERFGLVYCRKGRRGEGSAWRVDERRKERRREEEELTCEARSRDQQRQPPVDPKLCRNPKRLVQQLRRRSRIGKISSSFSFCSRRVVPRSRPSRRRRGNVYSPVLAGVPTFPLSSRSSSRY